ncbi:unnamed protein product [Cyprideis torosa]|uniref:Uncharacterized protein n=1 Tax=Cyprideis torosa TaxID=163714 RepID=A0A7R8WMH7_9CRUS|nr:unnamed protein product [Cyprideis torosa]CAG0905271.1 unnamed protein product [Cyprideis torosa]
MPMLDALKRSMLQSEYLKPEVVAGFDSYKYSCLDTSPLSQYVMHPFWNQVVKVCPGWIAPNVLTFAGFIWTVLVYLLLTIYDYSFEASSSMSSSPPVPSWVWLLGSWSIFLAHTLDGIDGKHARRTGTSSPLGELFDHGLDSWTTAIIPVCLYSIFGIQDYSATRLYFCLWNVLICFYLSHWEKYNTGLLYLPWSYDFSMLTCALVFLITGVLGHELWKVALPLINISVGTLFETMLYLGSMGLTLPLSALHVYLQPSPKHNLWEMHRPLLPLMGLLVSSSWWATHSPNGILDRDPRCFFFLTGTLGRCTGLCFL